MAVKPMEPSLTALLKDRKSEVVGEWLEQTLRTYPESASRFLSLEKDPFRNPVGNTLKSGLTALCDHILGDADPAEAAQALDGIVRMRAVQDFSAGQAVAFIFLFKRAMRGVLRGDVTRFPEEAAALEARVDELALRAFDVFMKCRQQTYEIKANEARRRVAILERSFQRKSSEPTG
jgi:hypothetical protein